MRKLEGLRFLQENFPSLTVDCIFVNEINDLDEQALYKNKQPDTIWRVRAGKKTGAEAKLPQRTCTDIESIKNFMREQKSKDKNMQFVIHTVSPKYFEPPFVGTLSVYNNYQKPRISIELQKVTKELVKSIDTGKRPRDWEVSLILEYNFLYSFPKIIKNDNIDLESIKYPITTLYKVGRKIFDFYDKKGKEIDTFSRFNIYSSGQVLLDDHRSTDSFISKNQNLELKEESERRRVNFIPKCECPTVPKNFERQTMIKNENIEILR